MREESIGDNAPVHLKVPTPAGWIETVLKDFDSFLLDHASCERKASATAMTLTGCQSCSRWPTVSDSAGHGGLVIPAQLSGTPNTRPTNSQTP